MAMRVLVVGHTAQVGGAELALLRVAESLDDRDVELQVLLWEAGPLVARLRAVGARVAVLPFDRSANRATREQSRAPLQVLRTVFAAIGFVPRLVRAIRGSRCDVVVANTLKAALVVAIAAPLAGRRWVWHLHDRLAADYLPGPLLRALGLVAAVGPRGLVANSQATLATLPSRARRRAVVAYPGLLPGAFEPADARTGDPVVGIVGRISPTKGQREFLAAAAVVASTHPDVRFRVVGAALFAEAGYEHDLVAQAAALGIDDRVEFTGWVDDPSRALRDLTVLVHASPVPEPFGQVVAEAMAAGVPVVATDAGGVPEMLDPARTGQADTRRVIADGVHVTDLGVLVSPGSIRALAEGIEHVLTDPGQAAERAAAAHQAASDRLRIEQTVDGMRAVWAAARDR